MTPPEDLLTLVQAWCDGELSPEQRRDLTHRLREDDQFADHFCHQLSVHHSLLAHFQGPTANEVVDFLKAIKEGNRDYSAKLVINAIRKRKSVHTVRRFAIAAAVILSIALGMWLISKTVTETGKAEEWLITQKSSATSSVDSTGIRTLNPNTVSPGARLVIGDEVVHLTNEDGHRLVFAGPGQLHVEKRNQLFLNKGYLKAEIEPLGTNKDLRIATVNLQTKVLGTTYVIHDDGLRSWVLVYEGSVSLTSRHGERQETIVTTGEYQEVLRPGVSLPDEGLYAVANTAYAKGQFLIPDTPITESGTVVEASTLEKSAIVTPEITTNVTNGAITFSSNNGQKGRAFLTLSKNRPTAYTIKYEMRQLNPGRNFGFGIENTIIPPIGKLKPINNQFSFNADEDRWTSFESRLLLVGRGSNNALIWEYCQLVNGTIHSRALVKNLKADLAFWLEDWSIAIRGLRVIPVDPKEWLVER